MALFTRVASALDAAQTSAGDLGTATFNPTSAKTYTWTSGTSTDQADRLWSDSGSIAASATTSLDLAGSALLDPFGVAVVFAKLKLIRVVAALTNVNNVVLTRPASNGVPIFSAAGDAFPILPGGMLEWVAPGAGVTVTASTGDLLDLVNSSSGSAVAYDIVLVGTSA